MPVGWTIQASPQPEAWSGKSEHAVSEYLLSGMTGCTMCIGRGGRYCGMRRGDVGVRVACRSSDIVSMDKWTLTWTKRQT